MSKGGDPRTRQAQDHQEGGQGVGGEGCRRPQGGVVEEVVGGWERDQLVEVTCQRLCRGAAAKVSS